MTLTEALEAARHGKTSSLLCPSHEDRSPSLSVMPANGDGWLRIRCHGGCNTDQILSAENLSRKDLAPIKPAEAKQAARRLVKSYGYTDEDGRLLFEACRFEPKDFRQRRPDGNGGWIWDAKGTRKVLFHLPSVMSAVANNETVFLVEGEKDAESLILKGLAASCNSGGAGKWAPDYTETLKGADVIIVPDNDVAGTKHLEVVSKALQGAAGRLRVLRLPSTHNGRPVKDVSDFFAAGATLEEFNQQVSAALDWQPEAAPLEIELARNIDDVQPDPLETLLDSRRYDSSKVLVRPTPRFHLAGIPISTCGNLTTISASPKAGKSSFVAAMAASVFPTVDDDRDCLGLTSSNPNGRALIYVDTEQSLFDHATLMGRVFRRAGCPTTNPNTGWLQSYCLTGIQVLELSLLLKIALSKAMESHEGIHSVILDGAGDFVADINNAEESNALVASLQSLAIEYDCPIVSIIHLNPFSEKTRGHLGSHLERKSESNIRLEKDADGVTTVWADKNRGAPILKDQGPRFRWNESLQMHSSFSSVMENRTDDRTEKYTFELDEIFLTKSAMRYNELISTVKTLLTVSPRTAERRVTQYRQQNLIVKSVGNLFTRAT